MRFSLRIVIVMMAALLGAMPSFAQNTADSVADPDISVSLITYYPGDEVFEVFGHTEIKLTDSVGSYYINYGVFDFNSPGFIMRYVLGETDYLCAVMPPALDGGRKAGRKIVEQRLRLTPSQAKRVWETLANNVLPQNREYRYRHFSDNCATRPRDVIEDAIGLPLHCPALAADTTGLTLRQVIRYYTRNYRWEQFGIDLVMGSACDTLITARRHTFVPMYLMHAADSTLTADGTPLVISREVVAPGSEQGLVLPATPWYLSPMTMAVLVFAAAVIVSLRDRRRGRVSRWFDTLFFSLAAVAGGIVWFLTFVSTHEAVSPNFNTLWLNPFLLLLAILPWWRKAAPMLKWCHRANILAVAAMAVVWAAGVQVPNVAFFPLVAVSLLRSAAWLTVKR